MTWGKGPQARGLREWLRRVVLSTRGLGATSTRTVAMARSQWWWCSRSGVGLGVGPGVGLEAVVVVVFVVAVVNVSLTSSDYHTSAHHRLTPDAAQPWIRARNPSPLTERQPLADERRRPRSAQRSRAHSLAGPSDGDRFWGIAWETTRPHVCLCNGRAAVGYHFRDPGPSEGATATVATAVLVFEVKSLYISTTLRGH